MFSFLNALLPNMPELAHVSEAGLAVVFLYPTCSLMFYMLVLQDAGCITTFVMAVDLLQCFEMISQL